MDQPPASPFHSAEIEEVQEDPLLQRLRDKYNKQRNQQLAAKRKKIERDLAVQSEKFSELPPSVELLTDETIVLFNQLEALCTENKLARGVSLIHKIREAANNEVRRSLSYLEEGYTSAFTGLIKAAEYHARKPEEPAKEDPASPNRQQQQHSPVAPRLEQKDLNFPSEWNALTRANVADELNYQSLNRQNSLQRRLTLRESLSSLTGLLAESLCTLLVCEVVRVYIYDEYSNLHCCACFPYHSSKGDPMQATFTEIMLAKQIHTMVCTKYVAVNGSEAQYNMLSERDMDLIQKEMKESGWGSMRSCLIFPIVSHEGSNRSVGMIHAVNKVGPSATQPARFSSDDETMMNMAARILGCILTRYPVNYFTLRVGEAFRKAVYPLEDTRSQSSHLPEKIDDIVLDAAETGTKALISRHPIMIYRAPISDVYQTKIHRTRNRKLGNLIPADSTLSSVQFNLSAINELWETGMQDNVVMHQKYRALGEELQSTKLLLRNLLDGLAATRTMKDSEEIGRYIKKLELFGRSESTDMLAEHIGNVLLSKTTPRGMGGRSSPASPILGTAGQQRMTTLSPSLPMAPSSSSGIGTSAFLSPTEAQELQRHHTRLNNTVASKIHLDGPDCIPSYSVDPPSKRAQIQFIDEVVRERELLNERMKARRGLHRAPAAGASGSGRGGAVKNGSDFATKRPFKLS